MAAGNKAFRYNYALVCCIPNSFATKSTTRRDKNQAIDIEKARQQHFHLVDTLRKLGVSILQLPADEKYPDCVFVEDCAVCVNGTALICKPASTSRIGEVAAVRQALKRDLGLKIVEVENERAIVEGGDVLWTGKEIIVGLSTRTNVYGAIEVSRAFPEYSVTTVQVPDQYLHLKNFVSMAGSDIMVVAKTPQAMRAFSELKSKVENPYKIIKVEDEAAVSTLYANNMVLHLSPSEIPNSHGLFEAKLDARMECSFSELVRSCGNFHSCVILVGRFKHPKNIPTTLE